jgi:hypothetical protein
VHVTRGYHALALDFSLEVEDHELAEHLEWLFEAFDEPESSVRYEVATDTDDPGTLVLRRDGVVEASGSDRFTFAQNVVQWINRVAVDPEYAVMSHAGGIERDGIACVLPADPESGKTTLTTGLVRAGYSYLTDEAVSFDWDTGEIEPYPKPLSIDPGSQYLFPELRPPLQPDDDTAAQWQVPPRSIRADAVGGRSRARFVVFPKYTADAETRLVPLSRAEALVELAKNTFRFREHPRRSLDALSEILRDVECARLVVGDLDDACSVIDELMQRAAS